MTEEIFGAILPIVVIDSFEAAQSFIKQRDRPLAAYLFSKNKAQITQWVNNVSAGNQCINDVMMFNAVADLPFGGTGPSGMGQYSGKSGFDNFSHLKAVLARPFVKDLPVRFAPYTAFKFKLLRWIRHL
jgi:aldehyde dehydrogenase (NAD+)